MEYKQNPISYIRTTPINAYARDLLQGAQGLIAETDNVLFARVFSSIFTGVSAESLDILDHVSLCTYQSLCLKHYALDNTQSDARRDMAHQASEIYTLEVTRLLGSLFSFDHPFWTCFYDRHNAALHAKGQMTTLPMNDQAHLTYFLQRHYTMFYVPLDCMYYLHRQQGTHIKRDQGSLCGGVPSANYELIMQSLRWLLASLFMPETTIDFNHTKAYRKALSLVDHLNLPQYKEFIIQKMHGKKETVSK
jgi:hypothetical protein